MRRFAAVRRIVIAALFLHLWNSFLNGNQSVADATEYCLSESFNATCSVDEVLLMTSARYGRMHGGRCIKAEFGHIGCSLDAMWKMDEACSGRQQCTFPVTNLVQMKACPDDVTSFLAASSVCVKASSHHSRCPESGHVTLTSSTGYISLTRNSVARCPWRIAADPLQRVVFTLYRFEKERSEKGSVTGAASAGASSSSSGGGVCPWTLVFEEQSTRVKEQSLCRVANRETVVFSSRTGVVTAYVQYRHNMALPVTYLLKYEVKGCPQIKAPPFAWVVQDENKATVKCNYTEETWFLACNEHDWKGELGNCSKGKDTSAQDFISGAPTSMPFGFMLAVVIGVLLGVLIGAIPLALVYVCLKRKWNKQPGHGYIRDGVYYPEIQPNLTEDVASMYPALLKQSPTIGDDRLKNEEYCYGYTDPYPHIGPCMPGPNIVECELIESDHVQKIDGTVKTCCHQVNCCHLTDCPDVMSQTVVARVGRPAGNRRLPEHVYESASFGRTCQDLNVEVNREVIPMNYKRELPVASCKKDYLKNVSDERSQTQ